MSTPIKPPNSNKQIVIVAGEASGDLHASHLINELQILDPSVSFSGMGGIKMKDAGANIFIDATELAVVGIVEVLAKYGVIKKALNILKKHLKDNPPDLLILIDYQEFNQKLAAYAKSIGIKVLFYIGPQVWAWRPKRVFKMAKIVDQMAVIFPFEVPLYETADVAVEFTGHPLVDEVIRDKTNEQARELLQLSDQTTVGLFPGSRTGEIEKVLPIMLAAAKILKHEKPDLQFALPIASTLSTETFAPYQNEIDSLNIQLISNNSYDVMQACDAIMTASGTATLEIGLMETPMVIVYKISAISYAILKRLVKIKHIGLVNILSDKEVVRELIQEDAKPGDVAKEILKILEDNNYATNMREHLAKLREKLGESGGSKNVARLALKLLNHE